MAKKGKNLNYKWEFDNVGGTTRVKIRSGADIAHLGELDPTMWTVLSCPVKGLEIDEKSMAYIDTDKDGKIRVNDVVATAKWATGALKNPDLLVEGKSSLDINEFNGENPDGLALRNSARQILRNLGKEGDVISMEETSNIAAIFAGTRFNGDGVITDASAEDEQDKAAIAAALETIGKIDDRSGAPGIDKDIIENFYKTLAEYRGWLDAAPELPFGENTDTAIALYTALDAKVKDFFMRSKLAAFTPDNASKLDVQAGRIEAISSEDLSGKADEIASYPIASITGKPEISLGSALNPAWESRLRELAKIVLAPDTDTITEEIWAETGARIAAYISWKSAKAGAAVESLGEEKVRLLLEQDRKESLLGLVAADLELKAESESIDNVDRVLHVLKDFYRLLRNFITFDDFYCKDKSVKAIFQSGTLIIDQRACHLCINVEDMGRHNSTAAASGMYLVYCDCTTQSKPGKITIAAAVTAGEVGDLFVGKNAVYYDNAGTEWDAVITKIIENPISVAQAFWSPYRRMAKMVEDLINKSAADKDAKLMKDATEKINAAPAATASGDAKQVAPPFDIGKFVGIFAAIGMALGMIGTAIATIFDKFIDLSLMQLVLVFLAIILIISGPAMVMAWMKLRRRNIAPLLNANGWAINASSKISIVFGETLTDLAKFPKIKLKDPYARKGLSPAARILITLAVLGIAFLALWLTGLLAWAGLAAPALFHCC